MLVYNASPASPSTPSAPSAIAFPSTASSSTSQGSCWRPKIVCHAFLHGSVRCEHLVCQNIIRKRACVHLFVPQFDGSPLVRATVTVDDWIHKELQSDWTQQIRRCATGWRPNWSRLRWLWRGIHCNAFFDCELHRLLFAGCAVHVVNSTRWQRDG